MKPTMDDVLVVLAKFDETDWDELRVQADDFHLQVFKTPREALVERQPANVAASIQTAAASNSEPMPGLADTESEPPVRPTDEGSTTGVVVRASSLGSFYRAPKPGAAPFVEVGTEVEADTQLCLLEVMKLYTSVQAGVAGVVTEILVEDGALVEHAQPLFVIQPHGE